MIWKIKSIGTLDMSTGWSAFLDDKDNPNVQPSTEMEIIQTGESAPVEGGMVRNEDYLIVTVIAEGADRQTQYDELRMAADTLNGSAVEVVGIDEKSEEWYVMARVSGHTMKRGVSKIILQVADSVWKSVTEVSQTWNITASEQTLDIQVDGTVEALPIFELSTRQAKVGGFGYRKWVRLYNPNAVAVLNELVDITGGGWNTAALTTAKMQSGGEDLRIYDQALQVDRFLVDMDTAATLVFAGPFNFAPKIEMTLSGTIANTGVVTSIQVKPTAANKLLLGKLPNKRGLIEISNTERYIYTGRNVAACRIDIAERAVRATSMASHVDGASIKWLEHDVWAYYGNSALDAPETEESHEAAFDIASSTNASRVYTSFGDKAGLRPGSWKLGVLKRAGLESGVYSGEAGDNTADPITTLGMRIKTYLKSGKPAAENAMLECKYSHPGGITSVTVNDGEKKRGTISWPALAALQKSKNGIAWVNQFNEATPGSLGVFVTMVNTALQTLGAGYTHVRFLLSGSLPAVAAAEATLEVHAVTVVITNPITAAMQAEEDNYDLDCEIQNTFTYQGETVTESIFLKWTMGLDETLTINSLTRSTTHSDGTNAYNARTLDAHRVEWLALRPGVVNQLKYIDAGTAEMDLVVRYNKRRKR